MHQVWRNAGIIAGESAKYNSDNNPSAIQQMFRFWRTYLDLVRVLLQFLSLAHIYNALLTTQDISKDDKSASEIRQFVQDGFNPYTGKYYTEDGVMKIAQR